MLYHVVELAGDLPLLAGFGVDDESIAARLTEDPAFPPGALATAIAGGIFYSTAERGTLLATIQELINEGLLDANQPLGPWTIRPTRSGRKRVSGWREQWDRQRMEMSRKVQHRILEELEILSLNGHESQAATRSIDVTALCKDLAITPEDYRAGVQNLLAEGKIAACAGDDHSNDEGLLAITDAGRGALTARAAVTRPQRDAQEAWVEVARLRRQLELAQRTPVSLIADKELRQRCADLLAAGALYDRVVREACVVLEDRVRVAIGAAKDLTGVPLMEQAFSPKGGLLRLSPLDQEQLGAMQLYRGMMAFFRNNAGHHLIDTFTQEDALRLVAWVDFLLAMIARALPKTVIDVS